MENITKRIIASPAGTEYKYYRIPGCITTSKGTVLVYAEARRAWTDSGECDLILLRSENGEEFTSQYVHAAEYVRAGDRENRTLSNAVMVEDLNGGIHLLFTYNVGFDGLYCLHSFDDGRTWSAPQDIRTMIAGKPRADEDDYLAHFVFGPTHAICLHGGAHRGRLLTTVWTCDGETPKWEEKTPLRDDRGYGEVHPLYSDDCGLTWKLCETAGPLRDETAVAELDGGRVLYNSRMYVYPYNDRYHSRPIEQTYRMSAWSHDGGIDGIGDFTFDKTLIDPTCEGALTSAVVDGKRVVLLTNNASRDKRENLTVRLSLDEGRTWSKSVVIDEVGWYSDVSVAPNGIVYVVHEEPDADGEFHLELFSLSLTELLK